MAQSKPFESRTPLTGNRYRFLRFMSGCPGRFQRDAFWSGFPGKSYTVFDVNTIGEISNRFRFEWLLVNS